MYSVKLELGANSYDLRLTVSNTIKLQKAINKSPIEVFSKLENGLPDIAELAQVLYYALQPKHSDEFNNLGSVYALLDRYIDEGNDITKLIYLILDVYKVSGIIPKETDLKNAMKK